ncbi:MAG: S9 family peptidase, partial [Candidatus Eisenbacteria bacterium]|nr:S9 family peptidase [Candidatus Eisenbacteria bacterium]
MRKLVRRFSNATSIDGCRSRPVSARSMGSGVVLLLLVGLLAVPVHSALADATPYQKPSADITAVIDAPLTPSTMVDPTRKWLLLLERPSLPGIEELAEPELRLAGMRLSPQTNGPSRRRPSSGMQLIRMADDELRDVKGLPENPRIDDEEWSDDGSKLLFTNTTSDGIELWILDSEKAEVKRLVGPDVSMTANVAPRWIDESNIVFLRVPPDRGPAPEAPRVPTGPVIQENLGQKAPAATYQDLLASPSDEDLFDHYLTTQVTLVNLKGALRPIGPSDVYWEVRPAPGGRYLLVQRLHRPYSYLVRAGRFPVRTEIWTTEAERVRELYDSPLQEQIPIASGSVQTGPRSFEWRDDAPATVMWTEALDGGDAAAEAEYRDQLYTLEAPFEGRPRPLVKLTLRYGGITWGSGRLALVNSWEWKTRRQMTQIIQPGQPELDPVVLFDRSWEDRYNDPGSPITRVNEMGRPVLMTAQDDHTIFLSGIGASPEGNRPFLDRLDLETRQTERLFRSEAPYYERVITL